jgi:hypothetical protein
MLFLLFLKIKFIHVFIFSVHQVKEQEVEIEDYSLVFWEDTAVSKGRQSSHEREGTMLLRTYDPFKGHVWKPVFVVLR